MTLELPDGPLAPGSYQLTLSGTRAIFDTSGNALAGNGSTAGTNYVQVFTIDRSADVAPVAIGQSVTVAEGGSTQIVLAATDTQGNPLTYSVTTAPGDGIVSAISNGNTLTYSPDANFFGADSFVFQATDPDGESSQATVAVTVTPVDPTPVATAQSVSVTHDTAQVIVLGGSSAVTPASQLTYTITTQPTRGTLTPVPGSSNSFLYTPNATYLGADSFSFTVTDTGNPAGNLANQKTSAPALVSIAVVDPAPVGVAASYTTRENVPLTVPTASGVLTKDIDSVGDTLTATLGTGPAHGVLTLNSDGSFTYTPAAGFIGADVFTYVPHGTYVAGAAATVTIAVTQGIADAPPPPPPPSGDLAPPAAGLPVPQGGGGGGIIDAGAPAVTTTAAATRGDPIVPAPTEPPAVIVSSTATVSSHLAPAVTAVQASSRPSAGLAAPVAPPLDTFGTPFVAPASTTAAAPSAMTARPLPGFLDPWADVAPLMAPSAPIPLPGFTVPGDETSALMLPVTPEISRLPKAFAAAAQRVSERTQTIITFVDPATGQVEDDDGATAVGDHSWLLVEPAYDDLVGAGDDARLDGMPGIVPSRISWGSHPP